MSRDNIEKLIGRYATNSLTEHERKELFEAALNDQAVFDALADEHALKDLLDDPPSRGLLIQALKEKLSEPSWLDKLLDWFRQPTSWALAGSVAVGLFAVTFVLRTVPGPIPQLEKTTDSKAAVPPSTVGSNTQEPGRQELEGQKNADRSVAVEPFAPRERTDLKPLGSTREETRRLSPTVGPPAKPLAKQSQSIMKSRLPHLDMRYKLLRQDPKGTYLEVEPTTIFRTGDKSRLVIDSPDTGYLYVVVQDMAGTSHTIFPLEEAGQARVEKGVRYLIPPVGAFTFDKPGDLQLAIIFSQKPLADAQDALEASHLATKKTPTATDPSSISQMEITLRHE